MKYKKHVFSLCVFQLLLCSPIAFGLGPKCLFSDQQIQGLPEFTLSDIKELPIEETDPRWFYFIYKDLVYDLGDFIGSDKRGVLIPISHVGRILERKKINPVLTEDDIKLHPHPDLGLYLCEFRHVRGRLRLE